MAAKIKPDFLIQRRVAEENRRADSDTYHQKMQSISVNTNWFESKTKFEFSDGEKRSKAFMQQEMGCANSELKLRRHTRLKLLYENEIRAYEEELAQRGLAIQRR